MTDDVHSPMPNEEKKDNHFTLPQKIGSYSIEGLLDVGGMSLVLLACSLKTGEPAIIKILSPKYLTHKEAAQRFLKEAKIIQKANHPNIVKLLEHGSWEKGLYIAMEYVHGASLRAHLKRHPFSLKKALDIVLQISYALCHLHSHGIIHGDVKPENILITPDDKVKVIDFGIAQVLGLETKEPLGYDARVVGTPIYMSPEVLKSPLNYSVQSDIYSLGILTYELILGKIAQGKILLSLVPKGLQSILAKALQPLPEDRYQDIVDFITDISHYLKSQELEKEKQGLDYAFEYIEQLENFQKTLTPKSNPSWDCIDVGFAKTSRIDLSRAFYDFFELGSCKKAIFLSSQNKASVEGPFIASMIRGILASLVPYTSTTPKKLFEIIQHELAKAFSKKVYSALVVIDTEKHCFEYFVDDPSTFIEFIKQDGENSIEKHLSKNSYNKKITYNHIKTYFLRTLRCNVLLCPSLLENKDSLLTSSHLTQLFETPLVMSAQKKAELLLQRVRLLCKSSVKDVPLILLTIDITTPS